MAEIIRRSIDVYQVVFIDAVDPLTKDWTLIGKPYQGIFMLGMYLMFVLKWGPKWMKDRPAFNLDKLIMAYNLFQVFACMYVFAMGIWHGWGWKYRWVCEPVDYSQSEHALQVRRVCYVYFFLKVMDLLDTVFFVLRKKFNQVSFLHVYHHCGMVMLVWASVTYLPGGHGSLVGVINSFVHVIMYFYYFLTLAVPSVKQSLWLKKHITQLQIAQFLWFIVHMAIIIFKPDCAYPRWTAAVLLPQNIFIIVLFVHFYIKTYIIAPKLQKNANSKELDNIGSVRNGNNSSNSSNKNSSESPKKKEH